jgi:hypothetical protein
MAFRDDAEALRARIAELESKLSSTDESELQNDLKRATREMENYRSACAIAWETLQRAFAFGVGVVLAVSAAVLVATCFGALVHSCQAEPLHAGFIVTRRHHEAYTTHDEVCTGTGSARRCHTETHHYPERWTVVEAYTTHDEVCTGTGSARRCRTETHHHPERWTVVVADGDQEVEDQIPNEEWQLTANGQWYCVTPPCAERPEPGAYEELPR